MSERPALSGAYLTLFEGAQSEAKRLAAPEAGIEHLAVLLSKREPDSFNAAFGEGVAEGVQTGRVALRAMVEAGLVPFLEAAERDLQDRRDLPQLLVSLVAVQEEPNAVTEASSSNTPTSSPVGGETGPAIGTSETIVDGPDAAGTGQDQRDPFARTARFVEVIRADPQISGRAEVVDELIGLIGRSRPRAALVSGPEGSGRTAILHVLADRLAQPGYRGPLAGAQIVRVVAERLILADEVVILRQILEDAASVDGPVVVAIDDLDVALGFGAKDRMNVGALIVLRAAVGAAAIPLVMLVDSAFGGRLTAYDDEFMREIGHVRIEPPTRSVLERISADWAARLAEHHRVTVPDVASRLALGPQGRGDTTAHPGLAIERLDGACARASLRSDRTVVEADFELGDDPSVAPPDPAGLAALLGERVMGQDPAVHRISSHLALTRARLDLRPDRPDGVFLFVGPTGVGKTELARATAEALYGDEHQLLRLDMSEYAGEWAISQLIGPPPGYVGSTDPESWLTTKIRNQPDTVLLLDEIEKAHHRVWNTFLQVFDVGRLTDSQGRVADFSRVVVAMTSNLGADAFAAPAVGFGRDRDNGTDIGRVVDKVKESMAPELINRLDDIIVFQPLSTAAIGEIAEKELQGVCRRLEERGYRLSYDPAVVSLLSERGYSPAYGARHLQRNIERLFLQPLASAPGRDLRATIVDDAVAWIAEEKAAPASP